MATYAELEYVSWNLAGAPVCAWCGRPGAVVAPLMSREHLACKVCYVAWYEYAPRDSSELREISLGPIGQKIEQTGSV